jgi:hypothetical protein
LVKIKINKNPFLNKFIIRFISSSFTHSLDYYHKTAVGKIADDTGG